MLVVGFCRKIQDCIANRIAGPKLSQSVISLDCRQALLEYIVTVGLILYDMPQMQKFVVR
jgi:hypothetical protein